ncbi:hypothetical protein BDQ17DRAFT_1374727 [Cyathus striatus]|nr:hypothetical protein BDQ17DRAFT_1374727 [Cyathus striatus]
MLRCLRWICRAFSPVVYVTLSHGRALTPRLFCVRRPCTDGGRSSGGIEGIMRSTSPLVARGYDGIYVRYCERGSSILAETLNLF